VVWLPIIHKIWIRNPDSFPDLYWIRKIETCKCSSPHLHITSYFEGVLQDSKGRFSAYFQENYW